MGTLKKSLSLWWHLAPLHRAGAVVLVLGNLAASLLEVVGLALFGTLLLQLTQRGEGVGVIGWSGLHVAIATTDLRTLAVATGAVYLGKNAMMLFLAWLEARLAFGVQVHLSVKTLAAMLHQDYEAASAGDQSQKINLLTGGMYHLAFNVLLPALTLVAETTLMLALVLFLVTTQPPFVTGMLASLCFVAGILVVVSRKAVLWLGGERHRSEEDKLRFLTGIFQHLREMYVFSAGDRAVGHLQALLTRLAATYRGFQMLQASPRFVLEVALMGVLLLVVYTHAGSAIDPTLVVSLGVFGVAGFRLLLGINRIVACVQSMRFAGASIERIQLALDVPSMEPMRTVPAPASARPVHAGAGGLRLAGVSYEYKAGQPVLRDVQLLVPRSGVIAIRGRSGSGKSTLLDVMAGLRTPTSGWIELDGRRIPHKQELVGRVAYAGQQPAVFPDTIRSNVAFGRAAGAIDDDAVWRALARAHLDDVVRALPGGLGHRLGSAATLSGGQIQRLALARALYLECDFLVLDEPTAALDAETEAQLISTLRELAASRGVVIVSHRTAPLEAADAVWELVDGGLRPDMTARRAPIA